MRLKLRLALFIGLISTTIIGNAYAKPSYNMDCSMCHTAPTVTNFQLPPSHDSLTVPITTFTATDTDGRVSGLAGVSRYIVTTSPTAPSAGDPAWQSSPPAQYTFAAEGLQTLYAWVMDAVGIVSDMASAAVDISLFVNTPPVADAGPDQTVAEGASVTLNGANSDDGDDGIKSFFWEPVGSAPMVALSDPYAEQPTFQAPDVGPDGIALTFRLTVTDYSDAVSTDTCIVNVSWVNIAPVADAGADQTVAEGTPVTLDGTASDGVDDAIDSYLWSQVDDFGTVVTLSDPTAASPTFTISEVGPDGRSLTFELTVTDVGGLQSTDLCVVNVTNINQAPVADAGIDQNVLTGVEVTLDASASHDPDGDVITFIWKQIDGTPVTLTSPSATAPAFIAPAIAAGTSEALTFELTVTDAGQLKATDICHIQVDGEEIPPVEEPPAEEPPVVEPPAEEPPVVEPPAEEPPVVEPPADEPPVVQPPAEEPPVIVPPVIEPPAACGDDALLQMRKYKKRFNKHNDRAAALEKKSERLEKASERIKSRNAKRAKALMAKSKKMKRLSEKNSLKAERFKEKYEALKDCIEAASDADDEAETEDEEDEEDEEEHDRDDDEEDEEDED